MKEDAFTLSRRHFVRSFATSAAAVSLPTWFLEREGVAAVSKRLSPNDRPGIALIGCGNRGRLVGADASRHGELLAVCDVDEAHLQRAVQEFTKDGKRPEAVSDFRKVMEKENIHVIINSTPDHWHTLINLAAARAGKDIYCEKPLTLTVHEGQRVIKAVREKKLVLQTGSQQRSDRNFRLACELVRNRRIGKLQKIVVWLPAGLRAGPFASSPVPPGLNWDLWQGQAPKADYVTERCHSRFRYWLDYSGGTIADWGAHHNDIALWAVGLNGPAEIEGKALAEPIPGGFSAFSEYEVHFAYSNGVQQVLNTTIDDNISGKPIKPEGQRNGLRFEGTDGWIWVRRGALEVSDDELLTAPFSADAERLYVSHDHMQNFFDCVRSRQDPICAVENGHRAAIACHLAVIALRLRRKLNWDAEREQFIGDRAAEANALLAREMRVPYNYSYVLPVPF